MTGTTKPTQPSGRVRRLHGDPETLALWDNPEFREAIEAGRASPATSLEESNQRAGITEQEWATANAEIDRLLSEEGAEGSVAGDGTATTPTLPSS